MAGKHSGRNALKNRLSFLGFDLPQDRLDDVFKRFKVCIILATIMSSCFDEATAGLPTQHP